LYPLVASVHALSGLYRCQKKCLQLNEQRDLIIIVQLAWWVDCMHSLFSLIGAVIDLGQ